jgi:hypothetical protein
MKLTKFEKDERKFTKRCLKQAGGELFSFPEMGCTVVINPLGKDQGENSDMVELTVSYCNFSAGDVWNRKRGEYVALNRWLAGQLIPVCRGWRTNKEIAAEFANFSN